MRYLSVVLYLDWASFHPLEHQLAQESNLRRKALHSLKLLDDGTIALLAEAEGDLDRYRELMRESPAVKRFTVAGDESGFCYSQTEATPASRDLLERRETGDFIIEMPIEYTDDGGLHMTIIGEEDTLMTVSDLFDDVEVELQSTGPYFPEAGGVFADLTERQSEVLKTAIGMGYYENPREATLSDLAETLDVDPATVGKHLRTIESKVLKQYIP
ncbi:helix-turn-helix domain-containing protein [Halovenus marina]|uniref:helix-turn-helix domain-containing protein n=1 Tax=Halovenus marina TaxID=3396621 RepID=UPI003F57DE45